MLVSIKWLRDYVDLPDDVDVEAVAHRLTMGSAEVEGIEVVGAQWDRELVTVGSVLSVDPHPDADRLRLATVDYGGDAPQQVVCGAPNLAEGQRIAFARAGATLFDARSGEASTLKPAKIRGFESSGMVLSERELGISDEHEGILVLADDAPIGTAVADYLGDTILDVHIWPNRPDEMCMVGIAREVAAIEGSAWSTPDDSYPEAGPPAADAVSVAIEDPELCARYVATVVDNVTIGPSPEWMQERLRAAGQRPISNVVDITNYVMLELGQPLHAFDLDAVQGTVVVRAAHEGEHMTTLDGEDRELSTDTLLITDDSGPIALAGVMGGLSSEVGDTTTSILLEAATFDAPTIRRTATRLGMRSEASARFERGLSAELPLHASRRATQLLIELCGGTARSGAVDVYPRPHVAAEVDVPRARLDTLIGFTVPDEEVERGLRALGFEVEHSAAEGADIGWSVRAPWWRTDIAIADDIAEEVVRIAGYDLLPATTPSGQIPRRESRPLIAIRERLRDGLAEAGMQEVLTYTLTSEESLRRVIAADELAKLNPLRVNNPQAVDRELLRPSLRQSLLEVVDRNIRAGADDIAVFEVARVYLPVPDESLPAEREQIVGAVSGLETDRWGQTTERQLDFFDAKGALEEAMRRLNVAIDFEAADEFGMLPGRVARLSIDGEPVGVIGEMHPATLAAFGIEQPVTLFEIDLEALLAHVPEHHQALDVPRFPAVEQDLALVVDAAVSAAALQAMIEQSRLVASARPFDVYRGDQLPDGKKSVAFAIEYQATDRTLTGEDANKEQDRILGRLTREFGAEPRS
ncbi:MAG TPA: phenylalanine--tRNA ligase subunit beta [Dehalococcoidia bacterium]|nr:phenylalanine--tRNA ligase subunit beta [Dehalococcoidia bacterium]